MPLELLKLPPQFCGLQGGEYRKILLVLLSTEAVLLDLFDCLLQLVPKLREPFCVRAFFQLLAIITKHLHVLRPDVSVEVEVGLTVCGNSQVDVGFL